MTYEESVKDARLLSGGDSHCSPCAVVQDFQEAMITRHLPNGFLYMPNNCFAK